ncbi:MAG: hypothetical protein A6D92_11330 [Symbiobacterium thermophilum]|uniref:Filament cap protein n=1 Tax=Symbiobacterium thermophilum TaxID=2734 RepID=A0A1Y2T6X0_SYMTR|nr:MAG: hypothetical protein A6D92_11330 [Symbiobacterium thermophilum]
MSMRLGGLISGVDTETLISALLELERVRIYRQEEKQEQLEAKQKAWRDVRSALTNIQSKLDQLRFPTLFRSRKVELSDVPWRPSRPTRVRPRPATPCRS